MWYPEALFPKSVNSSQGLFPGSEPLYIVNDDVPLTFPQMSGAAKLPSKLGNVHDRNKKSSESLKRSNCERLHGTDDAALSSDDEVVYIETKKTRKRPDQKESSGSRDVRPSRQVCSFIMITVNAKLKIFLTIITVVKMTYVLSRLRCNVTRRWNAVENILRDFLIRLFRS